MMKYTWVFLTFMFSGFSHGEELVKTELTTNNNYRLSILKVFPDSFPEISVVFDAINEEGLPLWNLEGEDINVFENDERCSVVSVKNISKEKGINMGLVIDASSSMIFDEHINTNDQTLVWNHYIKWKKWPKWYKKPIDFAKEGILSFLEKDYSKNDSVLLIPFSYKVLNKYSLSTDLKKIKNRLNNINPDGSTAFYDALYYSVEELSNSINQPVVVALTDGMDNSSTKSVKQVVEFAKKHKIKIFVVGLGKADKKVLKYIASETDGQYFYTQNANELSEIYLKIKSRIRSIYELKYITENNEYKDETRKVRFEFVNETYRFNNNSFDYSLSEEVMNYLKEKEENQIKLMQAQKAELAKLEAEKEENEKNLLIGGLLIILFGVGGFYVSRYVNSKPKVSKLYPNPVQENVTIEYQISDNVLNSTLSLKNTRGRTVRRTTLNTEDTQIELNLKDLKKGWYFATITTEKGKSEPVKIFKK